MFTRTDISDFIDGDYHNEMTNNKGVMGPNGIILYPGKYYHIDLLENGLIKVSNKEKTLLGLLSVDGKELLKMEFSYISQFKYGHASVCIGGHEENKYPYRHVGGKWGIIDKTGKFIIECDHDKEEIEKLYKTILIDSSLISECSTSKVLCSDCIPSDIDDDDNKDCYDEYYSGGDDDDTPSIYDNPYYNDNIDMDQQSIEFWNSL